MRIGELAACVGITPRALRHYESIGLLAPAATDPRTGYRSYGRDELLRALRIEQLKQAGVPLAGIAALLDDAGATQEILLTHRRHLHEVADDTRRRLALVDALLDAEEVISEPRLVTTPAVPVLVSTAVATPETLGDTIRRGIQRQRRRARQIDPDVAWIVAARFATCRRGTFPVEAAAHHPDVIDLPSTWLPARAVQLDVVGPHRLLPAAYDTVHAHLAQLGGRPTGIAQETYHRLGPVPLTTVTVFTD
jgi:DNA-binding transcriptional MerR regulator